MIRRELLQSAQQVVSAGLIGEGVKVVFDATVPYADLTNRVMHLRPLPEEVDPEALLHLRADCDHEMGHFGKTVPKALDGVTSPLVKLVANAIEDGLVERWVSARWIGCAENLADSNEKITEEIRAKTTSDPINVRARAINALQVISFGGTVEDALVAYGADIEPLLTEVSDLVAQLPTVETTADSVRLAQLIVAKWKWPDAPPPPPKPAGGKSGKKGKGSGKAKSSTKSPTSEPEGSASGKVELSPEAQELEDEKQLAEAIDHQLLGTKRKEMIASSPLAPTTDRYRAYTEEDAVEEIEPRRSEDGPAFTSTVRHIVPPLRRRLMMEFTGVGARFQRGRKHGLLDQRALHRVALHDEHVFKEKLPSVVFDADVTLLIDASGSMSIGSAAGRTRLYVAAQAACAFSMVLDLLHIQHECLAFTTSMEYARRLPSEKFNDFERVRPLRHLVVKPANKHFNQCQANFAAVSHFDEVCENVDGEAVLWAAQRLAARSRPGLVPTLIVFSDGLPSSEPENHWVLRRHLLRTVQRVQAAGITCIGVGIATASVEEFYNPSIIINDLSDLVRTGYETIRMALRAGRRKTHAVR